MRIHKIHPKALADDPFAAEHKQVRQSRRTETEMTEAIAEDEAGQGHSMTPKKREAFARDFFGQKYAPEVRLLARASLLDAGDGE